MPETVMDLQHFPYLSALLWIPLIGAGAVSFLPTNFWIRLVTFLTTASTMLLSWFLLFHFSASSGTLQFVEKKLWAPEIGMSYSLGVDGISFPLVLLTTLLFCLAWIASSKIVERLKGYSICFLLLEFATIGVFTAQDWFLFYMFWELALIPLFILIVTWGGARKNFAGMKFFIYTLAGSIFMLAAILSVHLYSPTHSFDMLEAVGFSSNWDVNFQVLIFSGFFLGFAVKLPVVPLHGWLPLAHVHAPTPVSVLLSAIFLKMGAYGLIRAGTLTPRGLIEVSPYLAVAGLVNIVYGAILAARKTDLKEMAAYASVSHMGFTLLGIATLNTTGILGASMQMISHGLISGLLFILIGAIYERTHTRDLTKLTRLSYRMPSFVVLMSIAMLGSMGLPGLSGFVSELYALIGAFEKHRYWILIASFGALVTAGYSLRALERMFLRSSHPRWQNLRDLDWKELVSTVPLACLIILLGVAPRFMVDLMKATVEAIGKHLQ